MPFTPRDWRDYPDTTTPITAVALEDLETRLAAYAEQVSGTLVTSLPGSPVDGQVIHFLADSTNGIVWDLRYRAASSSSYKWEFVGGVWLLTNVDTQESTTSTSYTDLATVGPSLTLPLAGDYDFQWGSELWNATTNGTALMGLMIGATEATDAEALNALAVTTNTIAYPGVSAPRRKTVAAGNVAKARYKASAGTANFRRRWLTARPVRVG